ncbi:MAG: hypothetical protein ABIJ09_19425 [Pseudomonadota bacterium]
MHLRNLITAIALALIPVTLNAADITDVIDAADGDDPFDANIEVLYNFEYRTAKITRESAQNGSTLLVKELDYQQMTHTMAPMLQVGVWHDLALFADFPLVIYDQRSGRFQTGVRGTDPAQNNGDGYSTLAADRCRFGSPRPTFCDPTMPDQRNTLSGSTSGYPVIDSDSVWDLFDSNPENGQFKSVRGGFGNLIGFGDMSVGLAWGPLNQERSPSQPNWVLKFRYTIPTGKVMNPLETASDSNPGGVGLGLHQFTWSTAFSRRYAVLEPYTNVFFTFGVPGSSTVEGMRGEYATANLYRGGITAGVEVVPYENKSLAQRFAIDLHGTGIYNAQQRTYSELSDMLNEVTLRDQYATLLGHVGFSFSAARFVKFDVGVDVGTDTNHLITGEKIGTDRDGNGILQLDDHGINAGDPPDNLIDRDAYEGNRYFDPVIDTPGRRLRIEETLVIMAAAHLALTF